MMPCLCLTSLYVSTVSSLRKYFGVPNHLNRTSIRHLTISRWMRLVLCSELWKKPITSMYIHAWVCFVITNRTHAMSGWLQVMTPNSSVGLFVIVLQVLIQPDKSSSLRISHHLPMRIPAKPIYQGHHGPIVLARLKIHWLIDAQILRSSAHFTTLVSFFHGWGNLPQTGLWHVDNVWILCLTAPTASS